MGASNQMYDQWGMDLNNMEEIKEMIMETNLYLVITTMIVSFLHSIFEFLAIKNGNTNNLILFKENPYNSQNKYKVKNSFLLSITTTTTTTKK